MPGTRGLEGLGALVEGGREAFGAARRGISHYLNEGPLGAIEVPAPGENPTAGSLIDSQIPEEPEEAAIMAAVPGAGKLAPTFRRAVINIGKQAKRAGVAKMSQQEALIWSHKVFRAAMRQRTRSGPVLHHAKTGETHREMAKRLHGRMTGKLQPTYVYNGKEIKGKQAEEVGKAMQEVLKRVRAQQ
jgi:hypothetical protein